MKKLSKLGLGAALVSLFALAVGKKMTDDIDKENAKDRGVDEID